MYWNTASIHDAMVTVVISQVHVCFIQFPFRAHCHPASHVRVGNVTVLQSKLSPQQAVLRGGGLCSSLIILHKVLELNSLGGFWGRRRFGPHSRGSKLRLRISLVQRGPDARAEGELWGGWEYVKACLSPHRGSGVKVPSSPAAEHEWIWGNLHEYSIKCYLPLSTFFFTVFSPFRHSDFLSAIL